MAGARDTVVVLGADVEGLAAAAVLARAGRDVHVFDALAHAGGANGRVAFGDGRAVPGLSNDLSLVRRGLLAELELDRHGLAWREAEPELAVARDGAEPLTIARAGLTGAPSEEAAYRDFRAYTDRLAGFVASVIDDAPPELADPGFGDLFQLAKKGFRLRSLGDDDMLELLRIVTMPAWDSLEERFGDAALRTGLVAPVLAGSVYGPRAAGTTALLLMRECTRGVEPVGGGAALVDALQGACTGLGVRFHLGRGVDRLVVEGGAVVGVVPVPVNEGEEGNQDEPFTCGGVVSALDPRHTLLDLLPASMLPHAVESEILGWRTRGSSAVLLVALPERASFERLITAQDPEQLERCADALKYGELPERPWLDVRAWDDGDASSLAIQVHGVPHALAGGWNDAARTELVDRTLDALEAALPGTRDSAVATELLTPVDLETRFGLADGQLFRGEQALDQLWLQRPAIALSRYGTPITGLHLAGAGAHPGGPFLGGAGVLGARAALSRA